MIARRLAPSALLYVTAFATAAGLLFWMPSLGEDWHYTFYPATTTYLAGGTRLFDTGAQGWFNPPWLLPVLVPFALLGETGGMGAWRVLGLGIVATAAILWRPRHTSPAGALVGLAGVTASLSIWDAITTGNMDLVVLAGLSMLYLAGRRAGRLGALLAGVGLLLALIKPQVGLLPALMLLWQHRGHFRLVWEGVAAVVALGLLVGAAVAGPDWPLRWLALTPPQESYAIHNISLPARFPGPGWTRVAAQVAAALVVLRGLERLRGQAAVAASVAGSFFVVPYISTPSIALVMICAWPRLLESSRWQVRWLAAAAWAAQAAVLLRPSLGWAAGELMVLVPVLV
ncbi:MAG: glycosyltransferase 87 family protein, partial [Chloroflexota bacterium]